MSHQRFDYYSIEATIFDNPNTHKFLDILLKCYTFIYSK
jgi:hypothetical protein